MSTVVLLVVLAVLVLWVIGAYNGLVSLKNQVVNAWKQIDVQLKRRHDLIPNLVNTVKGAMEFERSTLDAVISARNRAVGATGVRQTAQAEGELTQMSNASAQEPKQAGDMASRRRAVPAGTRDHASPVMLAGAAR